MTPLYEIGTYVTFAGSSTYGPNKGGTITAFEYDADWGVFLYTIVDNAGEVIDTAFEAQDFYVTEKEPK